MIEQLTIKIQTLRRDNVLLLTQLARAAKCLNAVSAENALLKTEVASLQSGGIGQVSMLRTGMSAPLLPCEVGANH